MNFQQEYVLRLLQENLTDKDKQMDTLDRKAQQNIAIGSIVVGVVGALKLNDPSLLASPVSIQDMLVLLSFGVYLAAFILAYAAFALKEWRRPMRASLPDAQAALGKSAEEFYVWMIDLYVGANEHNGSVLARKARFVNASTILIGLIAGLLALAVLVD